MGDRSEGYMAGRSAGYMANRSEEGHTADRSEGWIVRTFCLYVSSNMFEYLIFLWNQIDWDERASMLTPRDGSICAIRRP